MHLSVIQLNWALIQNQLNNGGQIINKDRKIKKNYVKFS